MVKYGAAQAAHVKKVRSQIDADAKGFFANRDWRNITPVGGRYVSLNNEKRSLRVSSFDVKPIASWVPHVLIPNHIPSCPNCEHSRQVDVNASRWITTPKILFGIRSHRYLDTKLYYCRGCSRHFAGYNLKSMQLDAKHCVGFFNFNLSRCFAVDDDLCSEIINSGEQATAAIANRLKQMVTDQYISDQQYYLYAVRHHKVKVSARPVSSQDHQQPTLDGNLQPVDKSRTALVLKRLRRQMEALKRKVHSAKEAMKDDIQLKSLQSKKKPRNERDVMLKGIGVSKLQKLIDAKIYTGRQLLNYVDVEGAFVNNKGESLLKDWKSKVKKVYDKRREILEELEAEEEALQVQLDLAEDAHQPAVAENNDNNQVPQVADEPALPPKFSAMEDPNGYNARFISGARIDAILSNEYNNRRGLQLGKMTSLSACILKIDFNYKIAKKIRVWHGRGLSFRPYKSIVTIQNEDGLTIYWKGLKSSESIKEIEDDLKRLDQRLKALAASQESPVLVIYVDNCCQVKRCLTKIFRNAELKLDIFHWMKRWNEILEDPHGRSGSLFRGLMSRAVFTVHNTEYERARVVQREKKKREPTVQEILQEANAIVPEANILLKRVNAVLAFIRHSDWKVDMLEQERRISAFQDELAATANPNNQPNPASTAPIPKRFLKKSRIVSDVIFEQLKHARCGCLSDPTTVNTLRRNAKTGVVLVARGTGGNEVDNLYLHRLTGYQIGISRGIRLIDTFFEKSNYRKQIRRLGEPDIGTFRTEQPAMLNSIAAEIGFKGDDLPYPTLSAPPTGNTYGEDIGFTLMHGSLDQLMNPSRDLATGTFAVNTALEDAEQDLTDDNSPPLDEQLEEDNRVDPEQESELDGTTETPGNEASDDDETNDIANAASVNTEAEQLLGQILRSNETTRQTFQRLTGNTGWIPFHSGGATPKTRIDQEEEDLFEAWHSDYCATLAPSATKGYGAFAAKWNAEVADRFDASLRFGNQDVVQIRPKTVEQLRAHYQAVQDKQAQSRLVQPTGQQQEELRQQLRATRNDLPEPVTPQVTQGINYPVGTVPFATGAQGFNPVVAARAFVHATPPPNFPALATPSPNNNVPWRLLQPAPQQQPLAANPLQNFNRRMWCISCGFRKRDHEKEESFGDRCKRDYCAKCMLYKHAHNRGHMGPYCVAAGHQVSQSSPHRLWYITSSTGSADNT